MGNAPSSGTEPGQRQPNGPQTTGRELVALAKDKSNGNNKKQNLPPREETKTFAGPRSLDNADTVIDGLTGAPTFLKNLYVGAASGLALAGWGFRSLLAANC